MSPASTNDSVSTPNDLENESTLDNLDIAYHWLTFQSNILDSLSSLRSVAAQLHNHVDRIIAKANSTRANMHTAFVELQATMTEGSDVEDPPIEGSTKSVEETLQLIETLNEELCALYEELWILVNVVSEGSPAILDTIPALNAKVDVWAEKLKSLDQEIMPMLMRE